MDEPLRQWAARQTVGADVIFEGTMVSEYYTAGTDGGRNRHIYSFENQHSYKGSPSEQVEIDVGFSDCSTRFSKGQMYLVFASEFDEFLRTGLCSRNGLVAEMGYAIRYLTKQLPLAEDWRTLSEYWLKNTNQPDGAICGEILTAGADAAVGSPTIYLIDVDYVFGWQHPIIRPIVEDVKYCEKLPAGRYRVVAVARGQADDTQWVGVHRRAADLENGEIVPVSSGQTIQNVDLTLKPTATVNITGQVMVGDRSPLSDESIEVHLLSIRGGDDLIHRRIRADGEGRFAFEDVPPDLFSLYAVYDGPNRMNFAGGRRLIPAVRNASDILITLPAVIR